MKTKWDRRANQRRKKKYKSLKHWIGAWSPIFIHLRKKKKNGKRKNI